MSGQHLPQEEDKALLARRLIIQRQKQKWKKNLDSKDEAFLQLMKGAQGQIDVIDRQLEALERKESPEYLAYIKAKAKNIAEKKPSELSSEDLKPEDIQFMAVHARVIMHDVVFKKPESREKVLKALVIALEEQEKVEPEKASEFSALAKLAKIESEKLQLEVAYQQKYKTGSVSEIKEDDLQKNLQQGEDRKAIEKKDCELALNNNIVAGLLQNNHPGDDYYDEQAIFYYQKAWEIIKARKDFSDSKDERKFSDAKSETQMARLAGTCLLSMATSYAKLGSEAKAIEYYNKAINADSMFVNTVMISRPEDLSGDTARTSVFVNASTLRGIITKYLKTELEKCSDKNSSQALNLKLRIYCFEHFKRFPQKAGDFKELAGDLEREAKKLGEDSPLRAELDAMFAYCNANDPPKPSEAYSLSLPPPLPSPLAPGPAPAALPLGVEVKEQNLEPVPVAEVKNPVQEEKVSEFDLAKDIALGLEIFKKYGRSMDPPKPPPAETDLKSPDGKLKARIEALEQSKYKPPLHCQIRELEGGQKIRVVVQGEGDLKGFPMDFKQSLQIRALHRARAAMKLIQFTKLDPEKARQLEQLMGGWQKKWDEDLKPFEDQVARLETQVVEFKEQGQSKAKELEKAQQELQKAQKALRKANQKAFKECVEKTTAFTARACQTDYSKVAVELDEMEPLVTWQDGRMPMVFLTRGPAANGSQERHVQMEDPYRSITPEQREEFYKILEKDKEPFWFKKLSTAQQAFLKEIVQQSKTICRDDRECKPGGDPLENTIPTTFRGGPGTANFSKCVSLSVALDASASVLRDDSGQPQVSHVYQTVRAATANPVDVDKDPSDPEAKQKIASENVKQLADAVAKPTAREYLEFWGISAPEKEPEIKEELERVPQIPLSISSLLSSAGIADRRGWTGKDNNREMIIAKEKAIRALVEQYKHPINLAKPGDPPRYVQFVLLGQNHELNQVRQLAGIRGNPDIVEEQHYDQKLIQVFKSHVDGISAGEAKGTVSEAIKGLSSALAGIQNQPMRTVSLKNLGELKKSTDILIKNPEDVKNYFIERMQAQQPGKALTPAQKAQASQRAEDFRMSAVAMTQLIALNRQGPDEIKATGHRNRPLFTASYENLIVGRMRGVNACGCKSSNDRRGLERIQTEAMRRIFAREGWLPSYGDPETSKDPKLPSRQAFVAEMVQVFKEGFMAEGVAASTPGAAGMKNAQTIKPRKIGNQWVIPGMQLWPRDLQEALAKEGFTDENNYLCKLNRVGKKLNDLKPIRIVQKGVVKNILFGLGVLLTAGFLLFGILAYNAYKGSKLEAVEAAVVKDESQLPQALEESEVKMEAKVESAVSEEKEIKGLEQKVGKPVLESPPVPSLSLSLSSTESRPLTAHAQGPKPGSGSIGYTPVMLKQITDLLKGKDGNASIGAITVGDLKASLAQGILLEADASHRTTEITAQLSRAYQLFGPPGEVYPYGTRVENHTVETKSKDPEAAQAAIYALKAHNPTQTIVRISGGEPEQQVAACEAALQAGFSRVRCDNLDNLMKVPKFKERLDNLARQKPGFFQQPPSSAGARFLSQRPEQASLVAGQAAPGAVEEQGRDLKGP